MSNISLASVPMQYFAYLNAQDVVEMILHLPVGSDSKTFIPISKNDESLIGKKYNRQTGAFEDVMFYYAILNDKGIVTEVVALEGQVTEENKILLDTYDQSLVGKWYNKDTKQFTEVPIHVLAKADTKEINLVDANGKKLDKWLQTKLDEMDAKTSQVESTCTADTAAKYDELKTKVSQVESTCTADAETKYDELKTKVSQVESTCTADTAAKYDELKTKVSKVENTCTADAAAKYTELNTKISKVESTCLADSASKYNTLDAKVSQVQSTCLTDSAVKYNTVNAKIAQVENGSFGGFKTQFRIRHNERITTNDIANGIRLIYSFNTGISGYFPKMLRLVARNATNGFMKADFYIVKNADGRFLHSYIDKSYISRADSTGKTIEEYGCSNSSSAFMMVRGTDTGGSYFLGDAPSGYYNSGIGNFNYTENTLSFNITFDDTWLNSVTDVNFDVYVY